MDIFDLFGKKKSEADASEARAKLESQSRAAGAADMLERSLPVLEEYAKELQGRGIDAKVTRQGSAGCQLRIQMKWTFGVVALDRNGCCAYIESNPAHSNGYARDDLKPEDGLPSMAASAGTEGLRAFLGRALEIFLERFNRSTRSAGFAP